MTPASPFGHRPAANSVRSRLTRTLRAPDWPGSVERAEPEPTLGLDYDTAWTRSWPARVARAMIVDNVARPLTAAIARPTVVGLEHLEPVDGPVIFAPNHASHLDTGVILFSLPARFRHHTVVAAAADHFFDRRWKAALWSFGLASIPIERSKVNRRSSDLAADLLEDGWNLLIYPEGGRTPDGWGQEFHGGAAYLARRAAVPVVPIHLRATRPLLPKGGSRLSPGAVEIRFGDPLVPLAGSGTDGKQESARRFSARIEAAVAALADEAESDWWSARKRAASGETPPLRGPDASPWRRAWQLPESARKHRDASGGPGGAEARPAGSAAPGRPRSGKKPHQPW